METISNEIKKFTELSVNDIIYNVATDYRGREKPTFSEIRINKIETEILDSTTYLIINQRPGYSYGNYNDFKCDIKDCNVDFLKTKEGFYTTDYNKVVTGLKDAALAFIKEQEHEIEKAKDVRAPLCVRKGLVKKGEPVKEEVAVGEEHRELHDFVNWVKENYTHANGGFRHRGDFEKTGLIFKIDTLKDIFTNKNS